MGRHNKERQKEMDAGCSLWESRKVRRREEKNRRTEKKKDIMKTEKICTLQTFKKSQCLMTKTKLTNKADQKSFPLNGRNIRVIGTSLDPSTLSGQKRLFIVKDCFHPAKDCTAITVQKQPAGSWGRIRISSDIEQSSGTISVFFCTSTKANSDLKINDNDDWWWLWGWAHEDYEDDNTLGRGKLLPIQSHQNVMLMLSHRSWPQHQQVHWRISLRRHENNWYFHANREL